MNLTFPHTSILMLTALVLCTLSVRGQQGIGVDAPHKSTALEIKSSKRGLLIPRIELTGETDATTMADGNIESLLVYNTSNQNGLQSGYYYWADGKWQRIANLTDLENLTQTEDGPWLEQQTDEVATDKQQNIYRQGNVAIGKDEDFINVPLDVSGAIRGGDLSDVITASIGENSIAVGKNVIASGKYSQAFGNKSEATAFGAFAGGGYQDNPNTTEQIGGQATGKGSFAFGRQTKAQGDYSVALGRETQAQKISSIAIGANSYAQGSYSFVMGRYLRSNSAHNAVFGRYNAIKSDATPNNVNQWNVEDPIFEIGNGSGFNGNEPNNALTILKKGFVGLGIIGVNNNAKPTQMLDVGGNPLSTATYAQLHKVRIRDLFRTSGNIENNTFDKIVTVNDEGILRSVSLAELENALDTGSTDGYILWNKTGGGNNPATTINDDMYHLGRIAIKKNNIQGNVNLDVQGAIRGGQNNTNPVGVNSFAIGWNLVASGKNSAAFGFKSEATGDGAFAGGNGTNQFDGGKAIGNSSFAFGVNTFANGNYSVSLGSNADPNQLSSSEANGDYSITINHSNVADGEASTATGFDTRSLGDYSFTMGEGTWAGSSHELVIGRFNKIDTGNNGINSRTSWFDNDPVFQIGNGINQFAGAANALTVLKNGWVGIGYHQPSGSGEKLRVDGGILATNVDYPDYVFQNYFDETSELKPDYDFENLETIKEFIATHHHLPGILPASALNRNERGEYEFNLSELAIQSLEKIEELYLHSIEQEEKIKNLQNQLAEWIEKTEKLHVRFEQLIEELAEDNQNPAETQNDLMQKPNQPQK